MLGEATEEAAAGRGVAAVTARPLVAALAAVAAFAAVAALAAVARLVAFAIAALGGLASSQHGPGARPAAAALHQGGGRRPARSSSATASLM